MTLARDASSGPNLADYRVHDGTSSRIYTLVYYVGNLTTATISNLTAGVTYYLAVTAYNTSGAPRALIQTKSVSRQRQPRVRHQLQPRLRRRCQLLPLLPVLLRLRRLVPLQAQLRLQPQITDTTSCDDNTVPNVAAKCWRSIPASLNCTFSSRSKIQPFFVPLRSSC